MTQVQTDIPHVDQSRIRTLRDLLAESARRDPTSPALLSPGRPPLTYAALLQQVDEASRALHGLGIARADRVAVVLPNGPEMAAVFLAVATACVCAPLNPAYTSSEFAFYLDDLQASALIVPAQTPTPATEIARARGIRIVEVGVSPEMAAGRFALSNDSPSQAESTGARERLAIPEASPEDVALVLHTSGTTSRPKIVPLTHANLCASAQQIAASFALLPTDRCLNVMPLFHIHGLVGALLSSLSSGGGVVCTPGFDATSFFAWLGDLCPTWYTAVPTMHHAILAEARASDRFAPDRFAPDRFAHGLRFIRSCSSPLPPGLMAQLEDVFGVPVVESYGMTEASHQISTNRLPPGTRKPGSVGLPAGTRVAILDEQGNILPAERTGEIALRGANVMAGYAGNPEANAKAYSAGWLRTGDLGRCDADGYIYITGRIKEMINRGGEKISPREVDEVLLEHGAIAQAVTFALPHPTLGEVPAAAVTLRSGATVTERELRAFAVDHIAAFKVPQRVFILDELPKGPTGKLQRIGLAERLGLVEAATETTSAGRNESASLAQLQPFSAPPALTASADDAHPSTKNGPNNPVSPQVSMGSMPKGSVPYDSPVHGIQADLSDIWRRVLELDEIGLDDDFFALGATSLQAAQVAAEMARFFGRRPPITLLFKAPTVRALANEVWEAIQNADEWEPMDSSLVPIQTGGKHPPLFCVHHIYGNIYPFHHLAHHLGVDQPVYGLQARGLDGRDEPHATIEEMARHYLDCIREVQGEGPYNLCGFSYGGIVAFEMARQLRTMGESIGVLALFDAQVPRLYRTRLMPFERAWCLSSYLIDASMRRLWPTPPQIEAASRPLAPTTQRLSEVLRTALEHYQFPQYEGHVTVFRGIHGPSGIWSNPDQGWGTVASGGVSIHRVPGDHNSLVLPPQVGRLARQLAECLHQARSNDTSRTTRRAVSAAFKVRNQ